MHVSICYTEPFVDIYIFISQKNKLQWYRDVKDCDSHLFCTVNFQKLFKHVLPTSETTKYAFSYEFYRLKFSTLR